MFRENQQIYLEELVTIVDVESDGVTELEVDTLKVIGHRRKTGYQLRSC